MAPKEVAIIPIVLPKEESSAQHQCLIDQLHLSQGKHIRDHYGAWLRSDVDHMQDEATYDISIEVIGNSEIVMGTCYGE